MTIEIPSEYNDKVLSIKNTLTQLSQFPGISADILMILDLLEKSLEEIVKGGLETEAKEVKVENIKGYIDNIELAVETILSLLSVMKAGDVSDTSQDLFKLVEAIDIQDDKVKKLVMDLHDTILKFARARAAFKLNMDPQTNYVVNHDVKKHMIDLLEGLKMAIYLGSKKGASFALSKVNRAGYSADTSIGRGLQNINSYLNYFYLALSASQDTEVTAQQYEKLAPFRFHRAKVKVHGSLEDITPEAMTSSLTLLLNSMAAVDNLGNQIQTELGEKQQTVEIVFEPNLDVDAAVGMLEANPSNDGYHQMIMAEDIVAEKFGVFTLTNSATEEDIFGKVNDETGEREGGFLAACKGYFENPKTAEAKNGLRIVMSLIASDLLDVEFVRKIGGLSVNIVENQKGTATPFTVRVSVMHAQKSSLLPPTEQTIIQALIQAGEESIEFKGVRYTVPEDEEGEGNKSMD